MHVPMQVTVRAGVASRSARMREAKSCSARQFGAIEHYCAACKVMHEIPVTVPTSDGDRWWFDGDFDRPTVHPSVAVLGMVDGVEKTRCHYTITRGLQAFLDDSTHRFAGMAFSLLPIPAGL